MAHEAQLQWEARAALPAGVAAIASALIGMGGLVYQNASIATGSATDDVDTAFLIHDHAGALIVGSALQAISVLLLPIALGYLFRATKYRYPQLHRAALPLLGAGALGYAVLLVAQQAALVNAENHAVKLLKKAPLAPKAANDLVSHELKHGALVTTSYLQLAFGLVLAAAVILIARAARRAGLLSGFLSVLGIIIGVLIFLPLFPGRPPIITHFWTIALGFLFLGRWPQGRGPAWETGEAIPWPTAAQLREQQAGDSDSDGRRSDRGAMKRIEERARERAARAQAEAAARDDGGDADGIEEAEASAGGGSSHPRSKKRKRKRRR